jgi:amidase
LAEIGRTITGTQYHAALEGVRALSRRVAAWWAGGWDLLLTPTIPEPPPPLGSFVEADRSQQLVPFTIPFNVTGQPAVSLPLGWSDEGLPIGVQLAAAYGREDLLLRVAAQLEQAEPWAQRRPALAV